MLFGPRNVVENSKGNIFTVQGTNQYGTSFENYVPGEAPFGWTEMIRFGSSATWSTANNSGVRVANGNVGSTANSSVFYIWSALPDPPDENIEVLALVEMTGGQTGTTLGRTDFAGIACRAAPATNWNMMVMGIANDNATKRVYCYRSTTGTEYGNAINSYAWALNTKYWMRFKNAPVNGTQTYTIWPFGSAEPGTPSLTNVPSASGYPTTGKPAMYIGSMVVTGGASVRYHWFSVGYSGASAPMPP